jgi:hypothetical protein
MRNITKYGSVNKVNLRTEAQMDECFELYVRLRFLQIDKIAVSNLFEEEWEGFLVYFVRLGSAYVVHSSSVYRKCIHCMFRHNWPRAATCSAYICDEEKISEQQCELHVDGKRILTIQICRLQQDAAMGRRASD